MVIAEFDAGDAEATMHTMADEFVCTATAPSNGSTN
jgi:hypothetical protein